MIGCRAGRGVSDPDTSAAVNLSQRDSQFISSHASSQEQEDSWAACGLRQQCGDQLVTPAIHLKECCGMQPLLLSNGTLFFLMDVYLFTYSFFFFLHSSLFFSFFPFFFLNELNICNCNHF